MCIQPCWKIVRKMQGELQPGYWIFPLHLLPQQQQFGTPHFLCSCGDHSGIYHCCSEPNSHSCREQLIKMSCLVFQLVQFLLIEFCGIVALNLIPISKCCQIVKSKCLYKVPCKFPRMRKYTSSSSYRPHIRKSSD